MKIRRRDYPKIGNSFTSNKYPQTTKTNSIIFVESKKDTMAHIAGVTTQKDISGNTTHTTINLKKHPEAVAALKSGGLMDKSDLRKEVEAGGFMTIDEAQEKSLQHLREVWPKK